jgi:hypothetical protein
MVNSIKQAALLRALASVQPWGQTTVFSWKHQLIK